MSDKLPEHEAKAIRQYVDGQTRDLDNLATLVQRVDSRRVMGRDYEIFDVHTAKGERWWVITGMTNLYDQTAFPDYDMAFTFHLGLTFRVSEQGRVETDEEIEQRVGGAWRRYEDAVDALNTAREAEDFQAIGVMCREALIAFGKDHIDAEWLTISFDAPKAADFKGWADIYAQALSEGRLRRYLKEVASKTWDLVVGLQHDSNAAEWDAEIAVDATANVLSSFGTAIMRVERRKPNPCPSCGSYRYSFDGDVETREGEQGWLSVEVCSACGYRGAETFEPWEWSEDTQEIS